MVDYFLFSGRPGVDFIYDIRARTLMAMGRCSRQLHKYNHAASLGMRHLRYLKCALAQLRISCNDLYLDYNLIRYGKNNRENTMPSNQVEGVESR